MKTAKKTAAPTNKITMSFGQWVKEVARARGDVAPIVTELRDEKGLTVKTPLKSAQEKFGAKPGFEKLVGRYNAYLRRGPATKKAA